MIHQFEKQPADPLHDRYRIILQGGTDDTSFGRVFDLTSTTHRLRVTEEPFKDGEVTRRSLLFVMAPLSLAEIAAQTDNFGTISMLQLKSLIQTHQVQIPAVKGRQEPGTEKKTLLEALRKHAANAPGPTGELDKPKKPPVVIVPEEIRGLTDGEFEVRCAEVGLEAPPGPYKPGQRQDLERKLVRKLGEKETTRT